jgi:hypothetical protein
VPTAHCRLSQLSYPAIAVGVPGAKRIATFWPVLPLVPRHMKNGKGKRRKRIEKSIYSIARFAGKRKFSSWLVSRPNPTLSPCFISIAFPSDREEAARDDLDSTITQHTALALPIRVWLAQCSSPKSQIQNFPAAHLPSPRNLHSARVPVSSPKGALLRLAQTHAKPKTENGQSPRTQV